MTLAHQLFCDCCQKLFLLPFPCSPNSVLNEKERERNRKRGYGIERERQTDRDRKREKEKGESVNGVREWLLERQKEKESILYGECVCVCVCERERERE